MNTLEFLLSGLALAVGAGAAIFILYLFLVRKQETSRVELSDNEIRRLAMYESLLSVYLDTSDENIERNAVPTAICSTLSYMDVPDIRCSVVKLGYCAVIKRMFGIDVYCYDSFKREFPELYAFKPADEIVDSLNGFWFLRGDKAKRVEVLRQVISNMRK